MYYNISYLTRFSLRLQQIFALTEEEFKNFVTNYEQGKSDFFTNGKNYPIEEISEIYIFNSSKLNKELSKKQLYDYLYATCERNSWTPSFIVNTLFPSVGENVTFETIKGKWGSKREFPSVKLSKEKYFEGARKAVEKHEATLKIFISHSSKDEQIVKNFCNFVLSLGLKIDLEKEVYCTSLAGSKPKTGEDFKKSIYDNLVSSKLVLQFISKSYKDSEVCLNEMGAAWVLSEQVVPLIIEKGEYDVGFINANKQQIQLTDEQKIFEFIQDKKHLLTDKEINIAVLMENIKEFIKLNQSLKII